MLADYDSASAASLDRVRIYQDLLNLGGWVGGGGVLLSVAVGAVWGGSVPPGLPPRCPPVHLLAHLSSPHQTIEQQAT